MSTEVVVAVVESVSEKDLTEVVVRVEEVAEEEEEEDDSTLAVVVAACEELSTFIEVETTLVEELAMAVVSTVESTEDDPTGVEVVTVSVGGGAEEGEGVGLASMDSMGVDSRTEGEWT